ncbi:MAG: hypothetical protein RRZ65_10465, partial [Tannerellaceae bacterium]
SFIYKIKSSQPKTLNYNFAKKGYKRIFSFIVVKQKFHRHETKILPIGAEIGGICRCYGKCDFLLANNCLRML